MLLIYGLWKLVNQNATSKSILLCFPDTLRLNVSPIARTVKTLEASL